MRITLKVTWATDACATHGHAAICTLHMSCLVRSVLALAFALVATMRFLRLLAYTLLMLLLLFLLQPAHQLREVSISPCIFLMNSTIIAMRCCT